MRNIYFIIMCIETAVKDALAPRHLVKRREMTKKKKKLQYKYRTGLPQHSQTHLYWLILT